ncbi:MAG: hypothetical protein KGH60_02380, partial [Candidatus Micrarchaeota archaeon]|nr:hypothetical protein [Candidatus Micrarchaeota archaeon]
MEQLRAIRPVLARALNPNQILILSRVNGIDGITSLLNGISDTTGVPLSTLKLNAKVLKDIGLI